MDRPTRSLFLTVCGSGLLMISAGCRSTRPEVPPGRAYARDGRQQAPIGFSTEPHPVNGAAGANLMPDSPGGGKMAEGLAAGLGRPDMSPILGNNSGALGPPGTSGGPDGRIGRIAPATDGQVLPAGAPELPRQSISPLPSGTADPTGISPSGETLPPDVAPHDEPAAAGSQVVSPSVDSPGAMGRSGDLPSPN